MIDLDRISKIASELENQLGIVNEIDEQVEEDVATKDIPEPVLEADEEVELNMEETAPVIADACPECGNEPCTCEVKDDKPAEEVPVVKAEEDTEPAVACGDLTAEEQEEIACRLGKVAKQIRVSKNLSLAEKKTLMARLSKVAKSIKKEASDDKDDPKIGNMVDFIKSSKSSFNAVKAKRCKEFGVSGKVDTMTVEQLIEALYAVAQKVSK